MSRRVLAAAPVYGEDQPGTRYADDRAETRPPTTTPRPPRIHAPRISPINGPTCHDYWHVLEPQKGAHWPWTTHSDLALPENARTAKAALRKLSPDAIAEPAQAESPGWSLANNELRRTFKFKNYYESTAFVNATAWISHRENHHPDIELGYNQVTMQLPPPTPPAASPKATSSALPTSMP